MADFLVKSFKTLCFCILITAIGPFQVVAHTGHDDGEHKIVFDEAYREQVLREYLDAASDKHISIKKRSQVLPPVIQRPVTFASSANSLSTLRLASLASISAFTAPSGNGALMAASFAPFKPRVRYYWDSTTFYEESDNMPDNTMMPNLMVGISSWQQQVPLPAAYFANTTNPENSTSSLGFGQPNYWRLPLVPTPSASPIAISSGNFQRGAVALASNGIAIFNPKNNTGRVSYEIGELDAYGGHCGLADDYHYHIIPTHLLSAFGGVLSNDKPVAWALDGYPIYGYVEPDGSARQALDTDGGHTHGSWGYHYHAIGTTTTDATHPYGTPQSPYLMNNFHGTVVNFGGQVDGQPEVGSIRASGTGGYTASPVGGASIVAFKNPVALTTDGSGHLIENVSGTPSSDCYLMRVAISGTNYDECWRINRNVNPRTLTITWRLAGATTTTTYTPTAGTAAGNRLAAYTMGAWTQTKLPDTSQTQDTTATFGEDSDYTINAQSFTDNGNGTVTDNVTGLMWQKVDNGESTWDNAVANASGVTTGGYTDWRLPTPAELFSIFNHQNQNPALNTTFFPNNPAGAADYWWTSDVYGSSTTNVWCGNSGGGIGGKPKSETISYSPPGLFRYHARYVRGAKPSNLHSYTNNLDGTVTDTDTGLMWAQVPAASTTWDAALSYAENLAMGGFTDWRLPNIKELQTLTDYTLTSATAAANIKPSINRTLFAKTLTNVTTNGTTTVTCADTTGLLVGMPIVDSSDVSSTYISNTTVPTVTSIPNGTTFVMSSAATGSGTGLTFKALPPPTAYWSSTSLRGDTTKAWLVETGINNSVLAANGPTRNSQGIISYEAKTSSYPVFVVRTTSVTNQIAVEQPSGTALTDGVSTVTYGSVNVGSTSTKTFVIRNNGSTTLSITGTSIDGTNSGLFTVTAAPAATIAAGGSTSMTVQFNASSAGSKSAALHIASSDTAVGAAFDITLSGIGYVPPPTVTNVTSSPTVPSNTDTPYVTATVTPASGATISGVQLTYSTGAQVTGTAFQELFGNTTTTTGVSGAMNAWTSVSTRAGGDLKLRGSTANHTAAIVLTNCTTNGTTAVTCASTTGLVVGMSISGTNIAAGTTIASVTNGTSFVLSSAATGSGSSLSLTAAGVTLTGCSLNTSPTIQCASTTGLVVGMGIAGAGLTTSPPNPTVLAITDATHFTVSSTVTVVPATLTATGCGLEFSNGTTNYTDTMATTTNAISSTTPTAGSVEFYVRTADLTSNNGWAFQVSPDNGTTWNTRLSESFTANGATTCTLNNANDQTNGSTTILCSNTSGLTVGNTVQGAAVTIASCTTSTTTNPTVVLTANTTGLAIGMFVSGSGAAGIPNGARITAINSGVSFTMSASATASATNTLLANYLNTNTTISSINANVSFVVNNAAFYSGSGITLSSVNHGFALKHYDLVAADMSANMKLRFQMSGYNGVAPNRPPTVDIDDVIVSLTTGSAPVTVTMYDDGLHGDGVAGDGVYGAQLPAQSSGTTVSYAIAATDSNSSVTTLSSAGSYITGPAPVISSNATLSNATPNVAYSSTLAASGGTGSTSAWTWSLVSGTLPNGLTFSSAGVISGTPTAQGTFNFSARVTDTAGRIATKAFALTVTTLTAPNVVIILTDDQGWGDIGYHTASGQVPVQTPNMDKLGTDGIRLERFYPTTVCAVTRGCLLTGRNSLRTSVGNQKGLSLTEHLMPQTFKAAGYQTYMVGKWHIGGWDNDIYTTTMNGSTITVNHEGDEYLPHNRGWDVHKGQYGGAINYFTHTTSDPGKNNAVDWWLNGASVNETTDLQGNGGYSTDLLADKAVNLIQNRDPAKPMLLYLAFNGVHAGVQAPQSYITKYQNLGVTNATRRTLMAAVDCMDVAMGRVLTALDTAGITNNTLVVFMSDNGGDTTTGSINTPLRGSKSDPYDGGLHTPAAIRWPGKLAAGVTSNQYVWVGDIFPTVAAAAGVTTQNSKAFDGVNLWPALQTISSGNPNGASRSVPLVTGDASAPVALNTFTDPVSSTSKVFKLIYNKTANTKELYNMTDDPYETTELWLSGTATTYTTIVNTLTTAITGIAVENYPPYIGPTGITQTVQQGNGITLYAPFSSYKTPTVQWRKGGQNITNASPFYNVTSAGVGVNGVYMATLTLTNVNTTQAGDYDIVISNLGGTTTSALGTLAVTHPVSTLNDGLPDAWKLAHGIDPTSTAAANGPLGDIDHDGRVNLLEYAFNRDPQARESDPVQSTTNAGYLQLSFPRRIGANDLIYTIETSDDLSLWSSSTSAYQVLTITPNIDGITETVSVRILPAMSSAVKKFARVKVTTQ